MPYIKQTITAGSYREVKKYYSYRYGRKSKRAPNWKPTDEKGKKANSRHSRRWLAFLIMQNFRRNDWRLDLTYGGEEPAPEEARKRLKQFIRKLRALYKKKGEELKYIYSTECRKKRIHHHLLLNNVEEISRDDIASCWPWSKIRYNSIRFYDGEPEDAERVAAYITKETDETIHEESSLQKWRWVSSRNLEKPEIRREIIKARGWKSKPAPPQGYEVMNVWNGYTQDGYQCQRAQYKKTENRQRKKASKQRGKVLNDSQSGESVPHVLLF